jgi:hypothetical protein
LEIFQVMAHSMNEDPSLCQTVAQLHFIYIISKYSGNK